MNDSFFPWQIVHVDLSGEAVPILERPQTGGVLVVFWWRDLPVGSLELAPTQLPIPASAVWSQGAAAAAPALGDRLLSHGFRQPPPEVAPPPDPPPALEELLAVGDPFETAYRRLEEEAERVPSPSVSVIVCTRERPEALARCLESLSALDPPPDEVVVVDNAPTSDETRRVVAEAAFPARYILESRPGLSVARNAGLRASTGRLVAFTDDDVEVHTRWVGRLQAAFDAPDVWAVTGLILPAELETSAQVQFERTQGSEGWGFRKQTFDRGFFDRMRTHAVPVWQLGAGANMAFRRDAFSAVGGFDERLGAGASGCSEDSEMWYRILAAGGQCHYDPASVVFHTHRQDDLGLRSQMEAYLQGHVAALLVQRSQHGDWGSLRRALVTLPRYFGGWALRRAIGRSGGPVHLGAQIRGWARGFGFYARNRRRPGAPHLDDPTDLP